MSRFLTTSDIITRLNKSLEDAGEFQLHTRLPDGSARVSTRSEQAAADFQAKLQQATLYLQKLSGHEQLEWANEQRLEGNDLYAKKLYEEAIDVYLTCLIVAGDRGSSASIENDRLELFFKTMNNLALCTLQLKWYRKTVEFCTLALKEKQIDDGMFMLEKAKLYYKRAKASRLRGDYQVDDIKKASYCLERSDRAQEPDFKMAIQREHQLLQEAIAQAQVNKKKQEASMQRLLTQSDDRVDPLYESSSIPDREFSTIRAPMLDRSFGSECPVESYWALLHRQFRRWL